MRRWRWRGLLVNVVDQAEGRSRDKNDDGDVVGETISLCKASTCRRRRRRGQPRGASGCAIVKEESEAVTASCEADRAAAPE